jgi:hypothetical protein
VVQRQNGPLIIRPLLVPGAARSPFFGARALLLLSNLSRDIEVPTNALTLTFKLTPAEVKIAQSIGKRTAAELFAELQAEAAERGIKLIASDDGTFEPVEGAKCNGKTED